MTASVSRLPLTIMLLLPALAGLAPGQAVGLEKSSEKVSLPKPGRLSVVGVVSGVGKGVHVEVGGNQTMVGEGLRVVLSEVEGIVDRPASVPLAGMPPGVAQAVRMMNTTGKRKVDRLIFIGK